MDVNSRLKSSFWHLVPNARKCDIVMTILLAESNAVKIIDGCGPSFAPLHNPTFGASFDPLAVGIYKWRWSRTIPRRILHGGRVTRMWVESSRFPLGNLLWNFYLALGILGNQNSN